MVNVTNDKGNVSVKASGEILDLAAEMAGIMTSMLNAFNENAPDEIVTYALASTFRDRLNTWVEENGSEQLKRLWHLHDGTQMN